MSEVSLVPHHFRNVSMWRPVLLRNDRFCLSYCRVMPGQLATDEVFTAHIPHILYEPSAQPALAPFRRDDPDGRHWIRSGLCRSHRIVIGR